MRQQECQRETRDNPAAEIVKERFPQRESQQPYNFFVSLFQIQLPHLGCVVSAICSSFERPLWSTNWRSSYIIQLGRKFPRRVRNPEDAEFKEPGFSPRKGKSQRLVQRFCEQIKTDD
ncbi:hypothetical protein CEXT_652361 [Caerostris extrusa]|uniref:Uncharacterized protein n=1 Tax=Caerostris extrusa TaxID=172846 RepID=A0AAV4RA64_CAEEX|nr:hypothetical protein CEXT_652361 [Caerostris extrusa]